MLKNLHHSQPNITGGSCRGRPGAGTQGKPSQGCPSQADCGALAPEACRVAGNTRIRHLQHLYQKACPTSLCHSSYQTLHLSLQCKPMYALPNAVCANLNGFMFLGMLYKKWFCMQHETAKLAEGNILAGQAGPVSVNSASPAICMAILSSTCCTLTACAAVSSGHKCRAEGRNPLS